MKVSLIEQMNVDYMVVRVYSVELKAVVSSRRLHEVGNVCQFRDVFWGVGWGVEETEWNPIWYYEQA